MYLISLSKSFQISNDQTTGKLITYTIVGSVDGLLILNSSIKNWSTSFRKKFTFFFKTNNVILKYIALYLRTFIIMRIVLMFK